MTSSSDGVAEYGRPYQRPLAGQPAGKKFRRKAKRLEGDEFHEKYQLELEALESAKRLDQGLYCIGCRHRVGWKKMHTSYQVISGDVVRSWSCPDCGAQLREDNIAERPDTPEA